MTMIRCYPEIRSPHRPTVDACSRPRSSPTTSAATTQDRLTARTGRLEWARTWDPAPAAPARAARDDPGRRRRSGGVRGAALALAGHRFHLRRRDAACTCSSAKDAAAAAETTLAAAELGDARALGYEDWVADAVLLLGPLYLPTCWNPSDRAAALAEAGRVAAPRRHPRRGRDQPLLPKPYDGLRDGLGGRRAGRRSSPACTTGNPPQPAGAPVPGSTTAHLCHPTSSPTRSPRPASTLTALVAVEGPGRILANVDDWLDDPDRRAWLLHQLRRVEAEPSLLGARPARCSPSPAACLRRTGGAPSRLKHGVAVSREW